MTKAAAGSSAVYRQTLERLDEWFAAARARNPGVVPCTAGCTACCHGPFDISAADTELLLEGLALLPPAAHAGVRDRAAALVARLEERLPGWEAPHDIGAVGDDAFDAAADALAHERCPLLGEDGRCLVYAHRPLVCRMTGLGMRTPGGRVIDNACPIRERFPLYHALEPAWFELEDLEAAEETALGAAAARLFGDAEQAGYETTIATAIVDFSRP